ncbi:hypothetical protein KIH39_22960 [Telmatocola sphagniphila]|uniref:Uncharacterized protein n=1 Tax=Telmatocola sphagniphila TaxID=1123043 RepID=A0A8E6B5J0_9BACT|nr:hypothetical protein [Telmatocola sphagniphila]QVL31674.1 hypothetical protein KIH39_22960 [Telmatocola sphagniphila]
MRKAVVGLLTLAILLSFLFLAHGISTGIAVPYHHPTPEQTAYESYHGSISNYLYVSAAATWLATVVAVLAAGVAAGVAKLK